MKELSNHPLAIPIMVDGTVNILGLRKSSCYNSHVQMGVASRCGSFDIEIENITTTGSLTVMIFTKKWSLILNQPRYYSTRLAWILNDLD